MARRLALLLLFLVAGARGADVAREVTLRARVVALEPAQAVRIAWRWGGEGLGGEVHRGDLTAAQAGWLPLGAWSPRVALAQFGASNRLLFVTFTLDGETAGKRSAEVLRGAVVEFELGHGERLLKLLRETGPDGPTAGLVIPLALLGPGPAPSPEFVAGVQTVSDYARGRQARLAALPWAGAPVPRRFAFLTDCGGYRPGSGYACRTTNRETMLAEFAALRQLGVNGFRNAPDFVLDQMRAGDALGPGFARIRATGGLGYPVERLTKGKPSPGAGCPYHPAMAGWRERVTADAARLMDETVRKLPVEEYWLLTVDEIGSVFDLAPEGKDHQGCCPYCRAAFRAYLRAKGLTPADFDAASWDDLRSTAGYFARTQAEADLDKTVVDQTDEAARRAQARPPAPPGAPAGPPPMEFGTRRAPLSPRGWARLHYWSRRFNNDASAQLFAPQRAYFDEQNQRKRAALAAGRGEALEARQPWVYAYALRGNTYLMGGHSLDFFDFYRHADNGFMYETSNRDPRVWQWDSYLCDVGRMLSDQLGTRFGLYVKPHRGAPIQRCLTALAREAKVVYWYTYGPDWVKGDSFSERPWALTAVSRAARLVAAAEDVLYAGRWAQPARVAVVRPRTSECFESAASWENGKWVYAALAQAQLPVDPLDEEWLLGLDLSRYRAIYVSGSHLRADVAAKLAAWVAAGGTLVTSGWGLARDEADQPLAVLQPVLGLRSRPAVELWRDVARYGATALAPLRPVREAPEAAASVTGATLFAGGVRLAVGREVLDPLPGAAVLARFGDGQPAVTRHAHGRGVAWVIGFYAGVETSVDLLRDDWDMARDQSPAKRAIVSGPAFAAGIAPVVDTGAPLVAGALLRHPGTGRLAVTLTNWAYRMRGDTPRPYDPPGGYGLVPCGPLRIVVRGAGPVRAARSAWSGEALTCTPRQDEVEIALPRLEEADVLVLEPAR